MVRQRGVTLLESLIGLAVISAVVVASMHFFANMVKDRIDDGYAEQIKIIGEATHNYLKREFNTDVTGFGKSVNVNGAIAVADLIANNLLPEDFTINMSGNPYAITWRRDGVFPGYTVRAMIETKVDNQYQAKNIARKIGSNGGTYEAGLASGTDAGYSYGSSEFANIADGNVNSVFYLAEYVHSEKSNKRRVCFVDANAVHTLSRVTITKIKMVGGGGGGGGAHSYSPPFYKRGVPRNCTVNKTTQQWDCVGGETLMGPLSSISNLSAIAPYYNDASWEWYYSDVDWRAAGPGTIVQSERNYYGSKGSQGGLIERNDEFIHVSGDVTITVGRGGSGGATGSPTSAADGTDGVSSSITYNGITLTANGGTRGFINGALSAQDYDAGHTLAEPECNAIATNFGRGGRGGVSVNPTPNYGGGAGNTGAVFVEYIQW